MTPPVSTKDVSSADDLKLMDNGNHCPENSSVNSPKSVEDDRKRFIEHVRLKLSTQEKECEV